MDAANQTVLLYALVVVYALVVAGWWARHLVISMMRPLGLVVEPSESCEGPSSISVVVPARDERERVGPCLETLLAQGPVVSEVIVVDDRSGDGTAEVARAFAKRDRRVRVMRVDRLPEGWSGKAHACHVGASQASGPWLLFTDADCRFFTGGLAGAIQYAEKHSVELLTLWPRADHRTFWENMLIPTCGAIIAYWYASLRVNNPRCRVAFANGQFILIQKAAYECMGGHESAKDAVIEDVVFAQRAKQRGVRLRSALGRDIFTVRMYESFGAIWEGWTRIFIGALMRRWKLLVSAWSLLGGSIFPSVAGPLLACHVAAHGLPVSRPLAVLVALVWLHFVGVYTVSFRFWGLGRCNRWHLLLYPVSAAMVACLLVRGWWWMQTGKRILWRGSVTGPCRLPVG